MRLKRPIVVVAAVLTLLAWVCGGAAVASARVLILEQGEGMPEGGPLEPGAPTSFELRFSAGLGCKEIVEGALATNQRPSDAVTLKALNAGSCGNAGGTPTKAKLTSGGRLTISAKPKFAFQVHQVSELCEPKGCKLQEYPCVYEGSKITGTFVVPGEITPTLAGTLKRNSRLSDPRCESALSYSGSASMYTGSPSHAYYGHLG